MTSVSSQSVLLFVAHKAKASMQRTGRLVGTFLSQLCLAVLRIAITSVVFTACVLAMLHYMGVPVPGPTELLEKFDGVGQLVRTLS